MPRGRPPKKDKPLETSKDSSTDADRSKDQPKQRSRSLVRRKRVHVTTPTVAVLDKRARSRRSKSKRNSSRKAKRDVGKKGRPAAKKTEKENENDSSAEAEKEENVKKASKSRRSRKSKSSNKGNEMFGGARTLRASLASPHRPKKYKGPVKESALSKAHRIYVLKKSDKTQSPTPPPFEEGLENAMSEDSEDFVVDHMSNGLANMSLELDPNQDTPMNSFVVPEEPETLRQRPEWYQGPCLRSNPKKATLLFDRLDTPGENVYHTGKNKDGKEIRFVAYRDTEGGKQDELLHQAAKKLEPQSEAEKAEDRREKKRLKEEAKQMERKE